MKLHCAIFISALTLLVSACNFTLAADVTPPPDYASPTPMPTLGPLFPASAPDVANGAIIYVEKCAPCHGDTGFGDGEQGKQLPVTVPAFALSETAHKASPAGWFTIVSQGNLDRFMPPFTSLSDQERWDVVSYALTLHTTVEQIETGRDLFEASCADCTERFSDQKMMAALSVNDLVRIIRSGEGEIPAFGSAFTDDEAHAVAAYLRTLTFASPAPPVIATATQTLAISEGTVQPEGTVTVAVGNVVGSIDNQTGATLPTDLKVSLQGYEHGSNPSIDPQLIATFESTVNSDGTFVFENIEIPRNRLYLVKVNLDGLPYQSEYTVVEAGMTEVTIPPITVYEGTDDYSLLQIDALQMYFDYASDENIQILAVYSITNFSKKTVIVNLDETNQIPFIEMQNNVTNIGYEVSPFIQLTVDSFAIPPSETSYELIAFASLPKTDEVRVEQHAVLPIEEVMLLLPAGVTADGETLMDNGPHEFQGGTFNMYTSTTGVEANESISFTLSGEPGNTAVAPNIFQNQTLVIGAGILGIALILAGSWMYLHDRNRVQENDGEGNELDDPDSIMDSIIALDDLHRTGKLSDEAYRTRRSELKNTLKRKS